LDKALNSQKKINIMARRSSRRNSVNQIVRKKRRRENFSLYIYKVLKEISVSKETKGINRKAMNIMNSLVFDIFEQITNQSS